MIQTRDDLQQQLEQSDATGTPTAMTTALWDLLNLPGSGNMAKIGAQLGPKIVFDTKGILVTLRIKDTTENMNAVMAIRNGGHGVALISQEIDPGQLDLPDEEDDEAA